MTWTWTCVFCSGVLMLGWCCVVVVGGVGGVGVGVVVIDGGGGGVGGVGDIYRHITHAPLQKG